MQGLPGGNQVVLAGWSKAFTGIPAGTVVTLTYQVSFGCQFHSWWVSSGPTPSGNPITITVNSSREVIALCLPLQIEVNITSPQDGSTTTERLVTVTGTVESDNPIEEATISRNGTSYPLLLGEPSGNYLYSFETQLELYQGWNTITVIATDTENQSGSDTIDVYANIPVMAVRIELTWDTNGTDVDSHFIAPGYEMWDEFGDCYFGTDYPDWDWSNNGVPDQSAGDPQLDIDNTWGYGPEHIVLQTPPFNGIYQFKVDYYSGSVPTTATVRIWINDVLEFQDSEVLPYDGYVWDCACISWPSGTVSAGPCQIPTHTLTVYSEGCCPILVSGLPGGSQQVPADGNGTFSGIPENTQITLEAVEDGNCQFDYWEVSSLEGNYYYTEVIQVTMDDDHEATAWCSPTYALTVYSEGCCPILVQGLPGGDETVPGNSTDVFSGIPQNTDITLTAQTGEDCGFDYWRVDEDPSTQDNPIVVTMDSDHEATAWCNPLYTLTVYSDGCCDVFLTWEGGNATVYAGGNDTFVFTEYTEVFLSPMYDYMCCFDYWLVDGEEFPGFEGVIMDQDHTITCVCYECY